jgi:hypothetical protein
LQVFFVTMGSCCSKQQAVAVGQGKSSTEEAAVPETKARAASHGAASIDPAAEKGDITTAETPAGAEDEYAGAIAPVCELQRRQHLNNLGILYTVSL